MANYDSASTNNSKRISREFTDIDLDFSRNPVTNDIAKIKNVEAIKRSVKNLIQTNFYERPFQPELGSGVRDMLFENFSPLTTVFLERKIEEVISNYEPRVALNSVNVEDDIDGNRLVADIQFYVIGSAEPVSVRTYLQRLR